MTDQPISVEAVRRVLATRREEIVQRFHAIGTGIGRNGSDHIITVYLKNERDRPREEVVVDGVSLKFEVTGEISPY